VTAPVVRLRSLSEGQNQWLSSSPGHAGVPPVTFMFVRSATPHLSAAAEQQSVPLEIDVGERLPVAVLYPAVLGTVTSSGSSSTTSRG
jgi:hypothetical protein